MSLELFYFMKLATPSILHLRIAIPSPNNMQTTMLDIVASEWL